MQEPEVAAHRLDRSPLLSPCAAFGERHRMILAGLLRDLLRPSRRKSSAANAEPSPALPPRTPPPLDRVPTFFLPAFHYTTDRDAVTSRMTAMKGMLKEGYHFADNLLTWARNLSMLDDGPFVAAWRSNIESVMDEAIIWRRYVLACAGYHCVQLDGDFVECGAYTGVGMKTVVDYLGGPSFPRTFWGYDTFDRDGADRNEGAEHGPELYDRVRAKFAAYPQVRLVKGSIPEIFATGCPVRIAYLHIDLNHAKAEIAALDSLFDRMVPGGFLILDDYEWSGMYREQKLAEDAWFDARRYRVMPLPTGQGLVIKR